nr:DDB1- and CUL4-associated factor 8 isoform X1 [Vanessa tameamea]
MEDNFSNDDEMKDSSVSPKFGGKKLKLNDGSSHDSLKEIASGSKDEQDENVDSGVSADKSESTSSDDRAVAAVEGPANEVVNAAPSGSNVGAILLDIRRSRRSRNYRKRRTPDRDSGSDNSSRDSDDLSAEEVPESSRAETTDGESATDCTNSSPSVSSSDSSSESNESLEIEGDEGEGAPPNLDTDSDDDSWLWNNRNNENKGEPPAVLFKTRPKHTYLILREIINRELGLTFPCGKTIQNDVMFEQKFYGSLHAVYRLEKLHSLLKHRGCVNSINFHPEGRLLASGSDDTNVVVWDWAKKIPLQITKTGHKSNVFQSKFLYLNAQSQLNIATCARDGQVRLLSLPAAGGAGEARRLAAHARAAHKLHVWPGDPHLVVSAGEDGVVMCSDVRADKALKLIHVKYASTNSIPLYSVAGHPLRRHELLLAGRDKFVRVYDTRQPALPLARYRPGHFQDKANKDAARKLRSTMHLTCAIYNHDGTEILGSYNDEDIYLFDAKEDLYEDHSGNDDKVGYTHRYSGHCNSATFKVYKGVAFFGPKSEYIVSGSDCSYIYMWEKKSEAIVQWMEGDKKGVVNCIETHPRFPVMATSGLDKDVKIWIPKREADPTYEGMEKVVRDNSEPSPLFNDFLPTLYSTWHGGRQFGLMSEDDSAANYGGNIEFDGNVCTAF